MSKPTAAKYPRLTRQLRSEITKAVLAHRFSAQAEALAEAEEALGQRLYTRMFPATERHHMSSLPPGYLPETQSLEVVIGVNPNKCYGCLVLKNPVRVPYEKYNRYSKTCMPVTVLTEVDVEGSLDSDLWEHLEKKRALAAGKIEGWKALEGVLAGFTTIPKLLKAWPELEEFTKPYRTNRSPSRDLPALRTDELNKLFKLPI